jgi:hypothetical protein
MPMEMPAPDPKALKAYEAIADDLVASTPTQRTKMMGMPSLKANGKMFAGLWGPNLVFKLGEPAHAEALALKGAHLFDPSGQNRPMKEWVSVPFAQSKHWEGLARAAVAYVETPAR